MKIDTNGKVSKKEKEVIIQMLESAINTCKSEHFELVESSCQVNRDIEEYGMYIHEPPKPMLKSMTMDIKLKWIPR